MRLSFWFLCPTLRLLPGASHPARVRLLFRVAHTARKRGASDLFFELSASLCSLLRRLEWNGLGFHGAFLLWRDHV
jgi:hypothetical protein